MEALDLLRRYGFPVNPHIQTCDNIDEVIAYCQSWEEQRHDLDYDTDGLVIKVDDFDQRKRLGQHEQGAALGDGVQVRGRAGHDAAAQTWKSASARTACWRRRPCWIR